MNEIQQFKPFLRFNHNTDQNSTYQFVFLKSFLFLAGYKNQKPNISWGEKWIQEDKNSLKVELDFFVVPFIKYYWDMLYKFRLRQSPTKNEYNDDVNIHRNFVKLDGNYEVIRDKDGNKIIKKPLKDYVELSSDKNSRFREDIIFGNKDKKIESSFREVLFALDDYGFFKARHPKSRSANLRNLDSFLEIKKEVPNFLYKFGYNQIIESAINYRLTRYLEGINKFFPQISKAVLIDVKRKTRLSGKEGEEWKRLYEENTTDCFYCGCPCHKKAEPARDHVIPFDFVLSDELYNSVPSCIKCNSAKSNKLPDKEILKKVIERNESLENKIGYSKESFTKLYENCKEVYHGNRKEFVWQERDCSQ